MAAGLGGFGMWRAWAICLRSVRQGVTAVAVMVAEAAGSVEEVAPRIAPWFARWTKTMMRRLVASWGASFGISRENSSGAVVAAARVPMRWRLRTTETWLRVWPPFSPRRTWVEAMGSTRAA